MAQLILKDLVGRVFIKLGNISSQQLSLLVLMENLYTAINKRIVQLRLSNQNYQLKSFNVTLNGKNEFPVPDDFGREVVLELLSYNQISSPVEMQNFANILNTDRSAAAFYKTDEGVGKVRFNNLHASTGYKVKIWYEPDTPIARKLSTLLPLNNQFSDMIITDCAWMCVPDVQYHPDEKVNSVKQDKKLANLAIQLQEWNELFKDEIEPSKTATRVIRKPYRAGVYR